LGSLRHAAGEGLGEILLVAGDVTAATELEAAFDSAQAQFGWLAVADAYVPATAFASASPLGVPQPETASYPTFAW